MPRNPHKIERRVLLLYFVPFRHVLLLCYEIAIAFHFMCGFVAMVAKLEYLFFANKAKGHVLSETSSYKNNFTSNNNTQDHHLPSASLDGAS